MPQKALIIELDNVSEPTIVTGNTHGNTVRSAFLYTAPSGWTADVVACPFDFGVKAYQYATANQATYGIALCSYNTDLFYTRNFDRIARETALPFFQPMANATATESVTYQKANVTFTGGGATGNIAGRGQRVDVYDSAVNITGQEFTTSWVNGAVAGKAAPLVDAGLTPAQVYKAIRQQASQYSSWDSTNGFGKMATSLSVPTSYDVQPPLGVEMYRTSGNNLRVVFAKIVGDDVDAIRLYVNGEYNAEVTTIVQSNSLSSQINTLEQYYADFFVISNGGTLELNVSIVSNGVESRLDDYNERSVSGFTDNFVSFSRNFFMFNPAPKPVFTLIQGSRTQVFSGVGYSAIGTSFVVG